MLPLALLLGGLAGPPGWPEPAAVAAGALGDAAALDSLEALVVLARDSGGSSRRAPPARVRWADMREARRAGAIVRLAGPVLLWAGCRAADAPPAGDEVAMGHADRVAYLERFGSAPADYVLARLSDHRVVLLGEHHWVRHDAALVRELVPRLAPAGVGVLAVEVFPAAEQPRIDRLLAAPTWERAEAIAVLRAADWPYEDYLDVLRAAWEARSAGGPRLDVLALGPGRDWRETLLPLGVDYEDFLATRVLERLAEPDARMLVWCGMSHAFTRYVQPERPRPGEGVDRLFDRMGNVLWRALGEATFLVALHRPWDVERDGRWVKAYPVGGAVDAACAELGRPVGFDVAHSPFAELRADPRAGYARGHPGLRLVDYADGYVFTVPLERYAGVRVIPLDDYAPDDASLAEVAAARDLPGASRAELSGEWEKEKARLADFPAAFGWTELR